VAIGAWRGAGCGVLAAGGGVALAVGWTIRWRPGRLRRRGASPLALGEVLDLLRQAYGATAAWAVGAVEGALELLGGQDTDAETRRRGAALVQLASVDGRLHVVRDPEMLYIAVGDFPYAAGLALEGSAHPEALADAIAGALRRFVAGMRLAEEQSAIPRARIVAGRVSRLVAGALTLEGMARAAVELGQQLTHRGVALVMATGDHAQIVAVSGARSGKDGATLIYVDLDHFKKLNDTLGHPAGDAALKHVARLLEAAVRTGDLVARIGGEEFAVWLPRTPLREGIEVAERIRRT